MLSNYIKKESNVINISENIKRIELVDKEPLSKEQLEFNTLYKKLIDNVRASERLRVKINKDIKRAAPIEDILNSCLECINLMTGDAIFYNQSINGLKNSA